MTSKPSVTLENWQQGPHNRSTVTRMGDIVPTTAVLPGRTPLRLIEQPTFTLDSATPVDPAVQDGTVESVLKATYTDGLLVLKQGVIQYEMYDGHLRPGTPHMLYSISKSIVGAVAG